VKLNGRTQATTVVVSHDRELVFGIAHRIAMIVEGLVIAIVTPAEIKGSSDPCVQAFINAHVPVHP
jgi:ABC-type transporter Mla maintaining outer membrane lipid asymmetry ATPase subunit MlaF